MSRSWRILRAAVEQEILFPSKEVFEGYIKKLTDRGEPFEVIGRGQNPDGTYTALMRKAYNYNAFLRKDSV